MIAVLLAGGRGARLMPYTAVFPKPLMPLGDMPVIELLLRQLRKAGVTRVVLAVNHLHHLIRAFCGDGESFGLEIEYCLEDQPLGTAGPLSLMLDRLGDQFIVANGDLLTNFDIGAMVAGHRASRPGASIAVFERRLKIEFGIIETDDAMRLVGYREKPELHHLVSMGLYVLTREAVAPHLLRGAALDMPDLMMRLRDSGETIECVKQDCVWLDIGHPADYAQAQTLFGTQRDIFL
jgi:NDP-sugar pyrophosphorylase family protein